MRTWRVFAQTVTYTIRVHKFQIFASLHACISPKEVATMQLLYHALTKRYEYIEPQNIEEHVTTLDTIIPIGCRCNFITPVLTYQKRE